MVVCIRMGIFTGQLLRPELLVVYVAYMIDLAGHHSEMLSGALRYVPVRTGYIQSYLLNCYKAPTLKDNDIYSLFRISPSVYVIVYCKS